jgi:hypothetical protein
VEHLTSRPAGSAGRNLFWTTAMMQRDPPGLDVGSQLCRRIRNRGKACRDYLYHPRRCYPVARHVRPSSPSVRADPHCAFNVTRTIPNHRLAGLESGLGASPRGFESRVLRMRWPGGTLPPVLQVLEQLQAIGSFRLNCPLVNVRPRASTFPPSPRVTAITPSSTKSTALAARSAVEVRALRPPRGNLGQPVRLLARQAHRYLQPAGRSGQSQAGAADRPR